MRDVPRCLTPSPVAGAPIRFTTVASRATPIAAVFALPLLMACWRIREAPTSFVVWLRVGASLAAIAVVALARRRTVAQRVVLAFALEAASGVATLVYIDVPFIDAHAMQFARAAWTGYARATHRDITRDLRALCVTACPPPRK